MKLEEEIKTKKFSTAQHKAVVNILFTASWFNALHAKHLKQWDISTQQYNVLRILNGATAGSLTVQMIKDRMLDKTPNTTRLIDKLLAKNLVSRERSESDRRVVYVSITSAGQKLLNSTKGFFDHLDQYLQCISEKDAAHINSILDNMREAEKDLQAYVSTKASDS